ncbi:hypothetical protein BD311DRAFT_761059 [Dichomitus squalens]|uniref:EthD domain-containing protein n=1 Tax=Dichomitus squalens TaxID=114155 RepID=A0A4Q9MMH5_9APHY|nr:hypothetical protein BD311DRAFT_761059 [Dichomitus squalens]
MVNPAYLFVFTERGSAIDEAIFEDWYDNEHIPLRLNLPDNLFAGVTRWTAADGKIPQHLAIYNLSLPDATSHPAYVALAGSRSSREIDILAKLAYLDRRVYVPFGHEPIGAQKEGYDERNPGPFLLVAELNVKDSPEAEAEVERWYLEEHIAEVKKVPGWVRSRVWTVKEVLSVWGTSVDVSAPQKAPARVVALHEWESPEALQGPEVQAAIDTDWSKRLLSDGVIAGIETRLLRYLRGWEGKEGA